MLLVLWRLKRLEGEQKNLEAQGEIWEAKVNCGA
jgi:hypothetical protein